ncbi:putative odorant receptor 85d [Leptopilina boulardi]|uniref:putative odorant receptor 85d n=1 Tax=Leptopilina boulardi TaxID=63433 RepID=UPI0021F51A8E|nr:putative odorant receptor 85d [Leptopilina boulardi]
MLSLNIPMFLGLFKSLGNLNLTMECISPLLIINMCILMCLNSINMDKKLSIILEKIEKDWLIWSTEPEIEILKKHAQDGKKFRIIYFAFMMGLLISFLFMPVLPKILDWIQPLNESRELPPILFTDYRFFNEENYYFLIFLHNYIGTFWAMLIMINTEMIFMICTQHACAILEAVGTKLTNLVNNQCTPQRNKNFKKKIDYDIIFCVKQHKKLITFIEDIHKCFSIIFLILVGFNILSISVTLVQVSMKVDNPTETFRFFTETLGQAIHIFYLTVPCQQLIDNSMSLTDSVYKSNWYLLPIHSRKSLLMIMRRSSEPLEFMVGKIYTYSMRNFGMVIKTSISYFTVLVSLQ